MRIRAFLLTLCVLLAPWSGRAALAGALQDGMAVARQMDSRYFVIQLAPGVDDLFLVQSLGIDPQHRILAGQSVGGAHFSSGSLGDLMDAFFLWASNLLDMQLFSYRGNIKVVPDQASLADVYRRLYGQDRAGEKAFYVYDNNTVYVAAPYFTKEIVGHELAHAIISNFFVVQPPAKVQEVLAGYIEYQLRKPARR